MTRQNSINDLAPNDYNEFCKKILKVGPDGVMSPEFADPKTFDWETLSHEANPSKFGKYTLNPETANIEWSTISPAKIKKLQMQGRDGSHFYTVAKIFMDMHSSQYLFPGIELLKYLVDHPDYWEEITKDWAADMNFFGSIICDEDGKWRHLKCDGLHAGIEGAYAWPLDAVWNQPWVSDNDAIVAIER